MKLDILVFCILTVLGDNSDKTFHSWIATLEGDLVEDPRSTSPDDIANESVDEGLRGQLHPTKIKDYFLAPRERSFNNFLTKTTCDVLVFGETSSMVGNNDLQLTNLGFLYPAFLRA